MKKNKGFSMVELIIVIAIMAILAGALAPALIKYINKSRVSADVQTGNSIASAIASALTNETVASSTASISTGTTWTAYDEFADNDTTLEAELKKNADPASCKQKASKAMNGSSIGGNGKFYVQVIPEDNIIKVALDSAGTYVVYPTTVDALQDK